MTDNPAQFFDQILKYLSTDYNKIFTFQELSNNLPKSKVIDDNTIEALANISLIAERDKTNLINSLEFLNSEKLIKWSISQQKLIITSKGFIKIKTKGFEKEASEIEWDRKYTIFNNVVTPLIALLAFILSICTLFFKNYPYTNYKINNTNKQENTK